LERPTSKAVFKVRPQDILRWLKVLDAEQGPEALVRLVEIIDAGHDPGPAAVVLLNRLIEDNAEVHARSRDDSWRAVRSALPAEAAENRIIQATIRLAIAASEGRWAAFSAWGGVLSTHGVANVGEMWLWYLTREVLRDTAAARGATVADLLVALRSKLEGYVAERRLPADPEESITQPEA
jgi:hypothetical protein